MPGGESLTYAPDRARTGEDLPVDDVGIEGEDDAYSPEGADAPEHGTVEDEEAETDLIGELLSHPDLAGLEAINANYFKLQTKNGKEAWSGSVVDPDEEDPQEVKLLPHDDELRTVVTALQVGDEPIIKKGSGVNMGGEDVIFVNVYARSEKGIVVITGEIPAKVTEYEKEDLGSESGADEDDGEPEADRPPLSYLDTPFELPVEPPSPAIELKAVAKPDEAGEPNEPAEAPIELVAATTTELESEATPAPAVTAIPEIIFADYGIVEREDKTNDAEGPAPIPVEAAHPAEQPPAIDLSPVLMASAPIEVETDMDPMAYWHAEATQTSAENPVAPWTQPLQVAQTMRPSQLHGFAPTEASAEATTFQPVEYALVQAEPTMIAAPTEVTEQPITPAIVQSLAPAPAEPSATANHVPEAPHDSPEPSGGGQASIEAVATVQSKPEQQAAAVPEVAGSVQEAAAPADASATARPTPEAASQIQEKPVPSQEIKIQDTRETPAPAVAETHPAPAIAETKPVALEQGQEVSFQHAETAVAETPAEAPAIKPPATTAASKPVAATAPVPATRVAEFRQAEPAAETATADAEEAATATPAKEVAVVAVPTNAATTSPVPIAHTEAPTAIARAEAPTEPTATIAKAPIAPVKAPARATIVERPAVQAAPVAIVEPVATPIRRTAESAVQKTITHATPAPHLTHATSIDYQDEVAQATSEEGIELAFTPEPAADHQRPIAQKRPAQLTVGAPQPASRIQLPELHPHPTNLVERPIAPQEITTAKPVVQIAKMTRKPASSPIATPASTAPKAQPALITAPSNYLPIGMPTKWEVIGAQAVVQPEVRLHTTPAIESIEQRAPVEPATPSPAPRAQNPMRSSRAENFTRPTYQPPQFATHTIDLDIEITLESDNSRRPRARRRTRTATV